MTPIRRAELERRYEVVEALIAKAGSVSKAAKLVGMDRTNFRKLRDPSKKQPILSAAAPRETS